MDKITIIIADRDIKYIQTFADYIRSTEYSGRFILNAFSQKDSVVDYVSEHGAHILLSESELLPEELFLRKVDCTMVMDEFQSMHLDGKYPFVHKYQPLDRLISAVLSLYKVMNPRAGFPGLHHTDTIVLGIYSTVGGSGKTLLALNLAQQHALRGEKVLYISLEHFNSASLLWNMNGESGFSHLLYILKTNENLQSAELERFIRHDPYRKFDYLHPPGHPNEVLEMTRGDVESLISRLIEMSCYGVIVIDMDSGIHERMVGALCSSDHIFWIVTDTVQCVHKTRLLLKEYESLLHGTEHQFMQRVKFVLNKYLGTPPGAWSDSDRNIEAYLPYIPGWKAVHSVEQIFAQPIFLQQVAKLYSE